MSSQELEFREHPDALSSAQAQVFPFDWYAEMREEGVRYDPERDCWDVFRYDEVKEVMSDHETFSSNAKRVAGAHEGDALGDTMVNTDPPAHDRFRSTVEDFFEPDAIGPLEPRLRELAEDLLDDVEAPGEFDLMNEYATPLVVSVIAEVMGIPSRDYADFKEWSDIIVGAPKERSEEARRQFKQDQLDAKREMGQYFLEMMAMRERDPREDLVSRVVHAENVGKDLTDKEKVTLLMFVLVAGNVTTTNFIGSSVFCFANHDVFPKLRSGEADLDSAIAEALRYRSPFQWQPRWTAQEAEIGGETIPPGEEVIAWLGAANHDPAVFDDPEEFKPNRSPNRHLAFGRGVHFCLGSSLARLESKVALSTLLDRFDTIEVDTSDPEPVMSSFVHGLQTLPTYVE